MNKIVKNLLIGLVAFIPPEKGHLEPVDSLKTQEINEKNTCKSSSISKDATFYTNNTSSVFVLTNSATQEKQSESKSRQNFSNNKKLHKLTIFFCIAGGFNALMISILIGTINIRNKMKEKARKKQRLMEKQLLTLSKINPMREDKNAQDKKVMKVIPSTTSVPLQKQPISVGCISNKICQHKSSYAKSTVETQRSGFDR